MDAAHFRLRAARARELAQSGDDIRLSRMLLEVAVDLDAEAEAIESGSERDRRGRQSAGQAGLGGALLHLDGSNTEPMPVQIIALTTRGATVRIDSRQIDSGAVTLELTGQSLRLSGAASHMRGSELAIVFGEASCEDPGLVRLVRADAEKERIRA